MRVSLSEVIQVIILVVIIMSVSMEISEGSGFSVYSSEEYSTSDTFVSVSITDSDEDISDTNVYKEDYNTDDTDTYNAVSFE